VLWQAQHGATAEDYRADLERKGAPIPAYLWPPDPLPGVLEWFLAFWELSTERRFPGGPIPWSAIAAYPEPEPTFATVIRAADRAYLAFLAKPPEERKSLPVATAGIFKGKKRTDGVK
jgi:hypothetical protein